MSWSVGIKDKTKEEAKAAVLEQLSGEENAHLRELLFKIIRELHGTHVTLGCFGGGSDNYEHMSLSASGITLRVRKKH
jgi:hypothetical protein